MSENNFQISISHTTRKPRTNEENGKDYFFISEEEFKNLINNKAFLEYAKVFDNYYGSLVESSCQSSPVGIHSFIGNGMTSIIDLST